MIGIFLHKKVVSKVILTRSNKFCVLEYFCPRVLIFIVNLVLATMDQNLILDVDEAPIHPHQH